MIICPCGKSGSTRHLEYMGTKYVIHDSCEECANVNRQRLDLLRADNPSPEEFERRLLEPKS